MRCLSPTSRYASTAALVALVAVLGASCEDAPIVAPEGDPGAGLAALEIRTATLGQLPARDFVVTLDDDSVAVVGPVATHRLESLSPGEVEVGLRVLDPFCVVQDDNPRAVTLSAGASASIGFDVLCDPRARATRSSLEAIDAAVLAGHVYALADDSTLGRATWDVTTIEKVADYLAAALAGSGLAPAPAGTFVIPWTIDASACRDGVTGGPNVIGWIPGSDPDLASEHVLFVAHYDHIGVYAPECTPACIHNGANDNASGTAVVLALAEAFARLDPAPPRSTVFLLVSGEENGLCGSRAYVASPAFPIASTHAVFNFDMVGKPDGDLVHLHSTEGSGYAPLAQRVAAVVDPGLEFARDFDLGGTDSKSFEEAGVGEIVGLFTGFDLEYHAPGDDPDLLDYEFMEALARFAFLLGLEAAHWDPD